MPSSETTSNEELKVTAPSAWKGVTAEGVAVPLPSGNTVRIKRTMDLVHLMKAGKIPNPLAGVVSKMMNSGINAIPDPETMEEGTLLAMMTLIDDTVIQCVTEPRVEAPPMPEKGESDADYATRLREWKPSSPDVLPLTYIDLTDRIYIFAFAQGMAGDLSSFREEQVAAMASVADGKATPKPTKRAPKRK